MVWPFWVRRRWMENNTSIKKLWYRNYYFAKSINKCFKKLAHKLKVNKEKEEIYLGTFLVSRLIHLDKDPCLCLVGVGEVLQRIVGKKTLQIQNANMLQYKYFEKARLQQWVLDTLTPYQTN